MRKSTRYLFFFNLCFFSTAILFNIQYAATHSAMVSKDLSVPAAVKEEPPKFVYTEQDIKCLQDNIFYEARNQSPLGQMMVAVVTIQRAKMPEYPSTVCGVVHDYAQFSWTLKARKPVNFKSKMESRAWWFAGLIAQQALISANSIDSAYKNLAYYHKTTIHPYWAGKMREEFVIDDHVFYSKVSNEKPFSAVLR